MKKKLKLIVVMIALCISVILGVKHYQSNINESKDNKNSIVLENYEINKQEQNGNSFKTEIKHEEKKEEKKDVVENNKSSKVETKENPKSQSNNSSKQQSKNTIVKQTSKEQRNSNQVGNKETDSNKTNNKEVQQIKNVLIKDEVSGKVIGNIYCNSENRSVADVTIEVLNKMGIRYKAVGSGDTIYFSSIDGIKERSQGPLSGWCYYVNGSKPPVGAGSYKLKKGEKIQWIFKKDGVN
ncbi:DUF4430 domain-containing protein [Clostridium sp. MB40-C1]|uniref:DUF4430 domain-containing protein n=1 Tax=Clostridium sp. MB40-C1 TaxID=3070996 RepID=UPI0027E0365D|nr:DUF4430 domain-containing protein [Clostridium sp. MB40-C1]WMJ80884.1 DUF4430 domain-containing protein [Clostridium sp. MB40-C1]